MTPRTTFELTDKAGDFVAGVRLMPGQATIELTEAQAEYPLILGEVRRPEPPADAPTRNRRKTGDAGAEAE